MAGFGTLVGLAGAVLALAGAASAAPYPAMGPVSAYMMPQADEIAMARSAAPASLSADASVIVLGPKGYVEAAHGKNGFVCMVQRSWFAGFRDDGFWNPKIRGPVCFNAEAARSVLPAFMTRTEWVMSGVSREVMVKRTATAMGAHRIRTPEVGSITFMLSKEGYLGDDAAGPWHPHLMFYMPPMPVSDWGANMPGTKVYGNGADPGDPYAVFYVPVANWSDGSPDEHPPGAHHDM